MKKTFLRKLLPLLLVMQAVLLTSCDFGKIREILDDSGIRETWPNVLLFENQDNNLRLSIDVPTGYSFTTKDFELFPDKYFLEMKLKDFGLSEKIQVENTVYFYMDSIPLKTKKNYEITFTLKQKLEDREKTYTAYYKNEYLESGIHNVIDLKFVNIEDPNDIIYGKYLFWFSQWI